MKPYNIPKLYLSFCLLLILNACITSKKSVSTAPPSEETEVVESGTPEVTEFPEAIVKEESEETTAPEIEEKLDVIEPIKREGPHVPREFRAAWVATVANINWPSKPGLSSKEQQ